MSDEPKQYRYLEPGEVIRDGDEVEVSGAFNDPAKWQPTTCVGQWVPLRCVAHRLYRRRVIKDMGEDVQKYKARAEKAEAEVARLRELLRDVATSGQVMPDRRMHYTEVQIDWSTWDALAEFAKDSP